jgi:hypothetical protein
MARHWESNRAAAGLLGVGQGFLAGKPLAAYVDGADRWGFRTMVNRLRQGVQDRVTDWPLRLRRLRPAGQAEARGVARRRHL